MTATVWVVPRSTASRAVVFTVVRLPAVVGAPPGAMLLLGYDGWGGVGGSVPAVGFGVGWGSAEVDDEGAVVGDGGGGGGDGGDGGEALAASGVGEDVVELDSGCDGGVGGLAAEGLPAGDEGGESGGEVEVAEEESWGGQGA